jgi:hypothetical protein
VKDVPLILTVAGHNRRCMHTDDRTWLAGQLRKLTREKRFTVYQQMFVTETSKSPLDGLRYAQLTLKWYEVEA